MNIETAKSKTSTLETIKKSYKKANKLRKTQILKKYGVSSIDKLTSLLDTSKKDKKVTMTELASLVLNNPNVTIEISFQKMLKEKEIYEKISEFYITTTQANYKKELTKLSKDIYNGVERIATGVHHNKDDKFGRLYFTETTVERNEESNSDNRMILISLNHLNWAIINGVKYTVK